MGELFMLNPKKRRARRKSRSRRSSRYPALPTFAFTSSPSWFRKTMPSSFTPGGTVYKKRVSASRIRRRVRRGTVKSRWGIPSITVTPVAKLKRPAVRVRAPKRAKRRGSRMARRRRVTRYGKMHSLTVYRRRRGYQVAKHSRLVIGSRGRILNPFIPSRGELMTVAGIAGGFVASRYLPRMFDKFLPPMFATGLGKVGVQTATGIGVSWLVGNVLKQRPLAANILTGALLNAAVSLVDMYVLKGVLAEEGIAALADTVPEVVSETPGDVPATLPAGFSDDEEAEMSAGEQDVIVM